MVQRSLQDTLKTDGRLCIAAVLIFQNRNGIIQCLAQLHFEAADIGATGAEYRQGGTIIQQGQQQMFNRQELVTGSARFLVSLADGYFQFFTEHLVSISCFGS